MAKKKKSKVGSTKRRSRVGSTTKGKIDVAGILAVVVTTAAASYGETLLPASWDQKLIGGAKMAIGAGLPMITKNARTAQVLTRVGDSLLSSGTRDVMKGFGILSGAEDGNDLYIAMNGNDLSAINNAISFPGSGGNLIAGDDLSVINGNGDYYDDLE